MLRKLRCWLTLQAFNIFKRATGVLHEQFRADVVAVTPAANFNRRAEREFTGYQSAPHKLLRIAT